MADNIFIIITMRYCKAQKRVQNISLLTTQIEQMSMFVTFALDISSEKYVNHYWYR